MANGNGRGFWVWIFLVLVILGSAVLWWFGWLPAVGQIPHSGVADPTTIKIFLTVIASICGLFLIIAFFFGAVFSRTRTSSGIWPLGIATFILAILTVWAWLLDDKINATFTDGIPVLPAGYDAAQTNLYMQWTAFLIFMVVFITVFIVAAIGGLSTMWDFRAFRRERKDLPKKSARYDILQTA